GLLALLRPAADAAELPANHCKPHRAARCLGPCRCPSGQIRQGGCGGAAIGPLIPWAKLRGLPDDALSDRLQLLSVDRRLLGAEEPGSRTSPGCTLPLQETDSRRPADAL